RSLDQVEDARTEPTGHDAFLERRDELLAARLVEDQLAVERLGKTRIDDGNGPALGLERVGTGDGPGDDGPERDEQHVATLADDLAPADRQDRRLARRQPEPRIARVMQRKRMVLGERGPEQRTKLLLVLRRGDDEVWQLALRGQGEHPLVARAVLPDQTRP